MAKYNGSLKAFRTLMTIFSTMYGGAIAILAILGIGNIGIIAAVGAIAIGMGWGIYGVLYGRGTRIDE